MKRASHAYSRGPIGIPAALICIAAVSLWFLWPDPVGRSIGRRRQVPVVCAYVAGLPGLSGLRATPDLFSRVSPVGFHLEREDRGFPEAAPPRRTEPVSPLMRAETLPEERGRPPAGEAGRVALDELVTYRPFWQDAAVFADAVPKAPALHLAVSPRLRPHGLVLPELPAASRNGMPAQWDAVLSVSVGTDGRIEHVFVESGTGHAELDRAVVRAVGSAQATRPPEQRVEGWVTVSFGR